MTGMLITVLPMLGDYFTNQLLSGRTDTSMIGNVIQGQLNAAVRGAGRVPIAHRAARPGRADDLLRGSRPTGPRRRRHDAQQSPEGRPETGNEVPPDRASSAIRGGIRGSSRASPGCTWSGRSRRSPSRCCSHSTTASRRRRYQGLSWRWYWGDKVNSIWHNPQLHSAIFETLKLSAYTTLIAVPVGVAFALGINRWRGVLRRASTS